MVHLLFAKFIKCEFWLEKMSFLGHIFSKDRLIVDPTKVEAVAKWKWAENPTEIRSFLGLVGYYRQFIKDFSRIAGALMDLTEKKTNVVVDALRRNGQLAGFMIREWNLLEDVSEWNPHLERQKTRCKEVLVKAHTAASGAVLRLQIAPVLGRKRKPIEWSEFQCAVS
ncbi:uncharacterized protein LOC113767515 [Coffea eugenioides]|uniref:uncharacterized protein LOC113767515 n=1 Tax=Coffea eugenioides TaxID=49369 RepID=UPI000F60593D|nr:uncharacterized protein LOC113767515 [Coffea eugenioides]